MNTKTKKGCLGNFLTVGVIAATLTGAGVVVYFGYFYFQPDLIYSEFDLDQYAILLPKEYHSDFFELSEKAKKVVEIKNEGRSLAERTVVVLKPYYLLPPDEIENGNKEQYINIEGLNVDSLVRHTEEINEKTNSIMLYFEPIPQKVPVKIKYKAEATVNLDVIYAKGKAKKLRSDAVEKYLGGRRIAWDNLIGGVILGVAFSGLVLFIVYLLYLRVYTKRLKEKASDKLKRIFEIIEDADPDERIEIIIGILKSTKQL